MALKVYRTPIGFHDAYVAASSQKAALKAWGSDADLFARGVAEVVTDPALTIEALAQPGVVIRKLRGTAAEQLAAAPPPVKRRPAATAKKAAPACPRPDRGEVERAEAALDGAAQAYRAQEAALAAEEAALAERRRAMQEAWIAQRGALEKARDAAEERYAAAVERWQDAEWSSPPRDGEVARAKRVTEGG